jgi:hypothetical protein
VQRIISACLEQTEKFSTEKEYQTYVSILERMHVKFKIIDRQIYPDNTIIVKVIRDYDNYPVGDYLN